MGWVNLTIKVVVDYIYLNLTLNHIIIQFSMIISLAPKKILDLGFGARRAVVGCGWSWEPPQKIKFIDPKTIRCKPFMSEGFVLMGKWPKK